MEQVLRIPIVQIGTSRGIRIPKKVLESCRFGKEAIAHIDDDAITLRPANRPREGWEDDFRRAHAERADRPETPDNLDAHLWDALDD